jgi:uncharacterized DUF497 family protein
MTELRFEWHAAKAASNLAKHGVSFVEAKSAFNDENGILIPDPDHSQKEDRFILLGLSLAVRLLVVCHCEREGGNTIRIISARKAGRAERNTYLERNRP